MTIHRTAFGVGVDLMHLPRMRQVLETGGEVFLNRVFTPREQQKAILHPRPVVCYAKMFAAKEAVFKALSTTWDGGGLFTDIEIISHEKGHPEVILHGPFRELACGSSISVSMSYDGDYATATAMRFPTEFPLQPTN